MGACACVHGSRLRSSGVPPTSVHHKSLLTATCLSPSSSSQFVSSSDPAAAPHLRLSRTQCWTGVQGFASLEKKRWGWGVRADFWPLTHQARPWEAWVMIAGSSTRLYLQDYFIFSACSYTVDPSQATSRSSEGGASVGLRANWACNWEKRHLDHQSCPFVFKWEKQSMDDIKQICERSKWV